MNTDVSEECTASISLSERNPSMERKRKQGDSLFLGLLLDPEDRNNIFLRNVSKLLPEYTVSHPGRYYSLFICDI
jgi:hypothetical protein